MINKDDPRLTAYLLGELNESEHDEIQAALAESLELRQHVDGLRETVDAIQSAFGGEVPGGDELTSEQIAVVEAAAAVALSEGSKGQGSGSHVSGGQVSGGLAPAAMDGIGEGDGVNWRTWGRRFAMAAIVLYAVGMTVFAFRGPPLSVALNEAALQAPVRVESAPADEPSAPADEPSAPAGEPSAIVRDQESTARSQDSPMRAKESLEPGLAERNSDGSDLNAAALQTKALPAVVNQSLHDSTVPQSRILGREEQDFASNGPSAGAATSSVADDVISGADDQRMSLSLQFEMQQETNGALGIPHDESQGLGRSSLGDEGEMMGMSDGLEMSSGMGMGMGMGGGMAGGSAPGQIQAEGQAFWGGEEEERLGEFSKRRSGARRSGSRPSVSPRPATPQMRTPQPAAGPARVDRGRLNRDDALGVPAEAVVEVEAEAATMAADVDLPESNREVASRALTEFESAGRQSSRGSEEMAETNGRTSPRFSTRLQNGRRVQTEQSLKSSEEFAIRPGGVEKGGANVATDKAVVRAKTWKPASASTNRARLSVGRHDDLLLAARDTYVRIDGFRARVMFDLYYYNDRDRQLEGQFMLRLPDDASLHYVAFGATRLPSPPRGNLQRPTGKPGEDVTDEPVDPAVSAVGLLRKATAATGSDLARRSIDPNYKSESNSTFDDVKTAYVAPRQKAALAYEETVRRRVDPALVEWAGPGIFQTKVFPLLPGKLHRIVVGYDVSLEDLGSDRLFRLELPEGEAGGRVEFDIAAAPGTEAILDPPTDPFVSGGRAYYRYESAAPRDYTARISGTDSVLLTHRDASDELYFATQVKADLPKQESSIETRQAILMLDTSWSDRPEAFSKHLKLTEQILSANRDSIDEFAVMTFNVHQQWWREEFVENSQANVEQFLSYANELVLEGATDLHHAISEARSPQWARTDKQSSALPNVFLLSDAVATWGAIDLETIERALDVTDEKTVGGALFAYKIAGSPSDHVMMQRLADISGGAVFTLGKQPDYAKVARAHRTRPWQLVQATATGADELLVEGGGTAVYPGQRLVIAGRGSIDGPIELQFRRGGETKSLSVQPKLVIKSPAAARLFGGIAVDALEPLGGEVEEITVAFARYFRVPGRTCSMVMLESEADYQRFGVNLSPQEDQLVVASASVGAMVRSESESRLQRLKDARDQFFRWIDSLESVSMVKVPAALRLAMKGMPKSAFSFTADRLVCRGFRRTDFQEPYLDELNAAKPDFDAVMLESENMLIAFGADDAIKTASTMVEVRPADVEVLRSVAYRAIQWKRGDQAVPLVWRITQARPYQPQNLMLLGRSLASVGDLDAAAVCFDLVVAGNWHQRWGTAKEIAKMELMSVLQQINPNESSIGGYARARLRQLQSEFKDQELDVVVMMHWNTDRTDVDLHVTEPGGEVCYYKNKSTKSGGRITDDITEGLGPEMYTVVKGLPGAYQVHAKYFRSDTNRTQAPTEVLVTLIRNLGRDSIQSQTKRVTLTGQEETESVMRFRLGSGS